jgi:glycosyltransferase involved in cell wall biosynthesis
MIVAGDGDIKTMNDLIDDLGLQSIVSYRGWVIGNEKQELLKTSDVFVLPSYNEGLPISILEAMTHGMPIISTPVGGIPEIVVPGRNGYLVEPGDVLSLSRSLEKFILNHGLVASMGQSSLSLITPFLSGQVMTKLERLYSELLENHDCINGDLK